MAADEIRLGDARLQALLRRHRAARLGNLERDVAFSWSWAVVALVAYALLLSDVLRTGLGIRHYPYPRFESNQFMFFGPYAYSVTHIRHNETAGARDIWAYKYDSTSLAMRAVAEHLSIERWPPCVLYKSKCPTRTIAFATIFDMLDALVATMAQRKLAHKSRDLTLRIVNAWIDRIHHFILPTFFRSIMTRTTHAIYYDASTLSAPDFQFCSAAQVLPYACWRSWTRFTPLCNAAANPRCKGVDRVFDHALGRLRSMQKRYAGMTLDLVVLENQDDNSKPAVSFQGRKFYDIVFLTRVRDCRGTACFTVATDDFRYQAASITSNAEDSYSTVVVLRCVGQAYMWLRVTFLFVGCYYARAAEPKFAQVSVAKRLVVGLRTMFLVPSQVVTYGSVFPVACYVLAHIFDSAIAYEVVAQKFNSFLGVFTLDPEEFLYLSAVSMRSVWVLALLLHAVLFLRTRRRWSPTEGIPGVPEFLISFASCLTIMAQFRSIYFRDSRVLSIDEVVPSAHVATIRAFSYNSAFSFWGLMLTGNTQDAKCLLASSTVLAVLLLSLWCCLRASRRLHLAKRVKMYVASRSHVSYAAGTLWPTSALVISWNGLFVMHKPSRSRQTRPMHCRIQGAPASQARNSNTTDMNALVRTAPALSRLNQVVPTAWSGKLAKEGTAMMRKRPSRALLLLDTSIDSISPHCVAVPDDRNRAVESMIYLMNLAAMTDPIVLLQLYCFGGKPIGVYESRVTRRLFLLPLAARTSERSVDAFAWDEYTLLAVVSTADLPWWDLLQCG